MAHVGDAYYTGSVYDSASLAIAVRPILDPNPVASLNVRLTDGANFYTAGITVVSGSGPVNQGSPNLLSSAWPVKPTDGTNIIGVQASPTWITGTVKIENPSAGGGAASNVTAQSGSVTGLLVGGVALSRTNQIPIVSVCNSATVTSLTASVSSQLLISQNSLRSGLSIFNDSVSSAYIKYNGAVSTNDFSLKLLASDYFEVPFGYIGSLHIIWLSATGSARITEFV